MLTVITGYSAFNDSSILSIAIFSIFTGLCGVLGFGSFYNETINDWTWRLFKNWFGNEEKGGLSSHNRQKQENTAGSNQINTGDNSDIQIIQGGGTNESMKGKEVFSCPNGHDCAVSPPDSVHTKASIDLDYAKSDASGKIIPRKITCKKCQEEFTLYWYEPGVIADVEGVNMFGDSEKS